MAYTRDQVASLEAAIASGQTLWRFADREIRYQSIAAMMAARDRMLREIETAEGNARPRTFRIYQSGRGT